VRAGPAATPADSLESLRALSEQVASLQVTRCRMFHERVRVENGAVLRVSRGEPEPSPVRIGLCSPEVRARNLACGHTMARYVLLDAVRALHAAGRLPGAAHGPLEQALESVCNAIHLLDHQKGDAERQLALSSEREHRSRGEPAEEEAAGEAARSAAEVRRLEEQHDAYAEQIRELQGAVLAHLDAALSDGSVQRS
jgi:hypothetical protein